MEAALPKEKRRLGRPPTGKKRACLKLPPTTISLISQTAAYFGHTKSELAEGVLRSGSKKPKTGALSFLQKPLCRAMVAP
jgi:hypothetical protein